jgi:hypothetical protein
MQRMDLGAELGQAAIVSDHDICDCLAIWSPGLTV